MGNVYALYPTWRYSLFEEKTIGMNIKLGTGFAWFTKPYDKIDNPDNLLIGSHITNITEASLGVWFAFDPQWKIEAGASFLHCSNGHTAIPNFGLNDITGKIGVIYSPGTISERKTHNHRFAKMDTSWRKTISASIGRHELAQTSHPTDGPTYSIYKLSGYLSKRLSPINEIQFGISISYYESFYTYIHLNDYYDHFQHLSSTVFTLHVGHEFLMNRFGLVTDLGIKVTDPFYRSYFIEQNSSLWYKSVFAPKVGFKFYPIWSSFEKQKLALGMFIKANGIQADFVEYSLSYTF